MEHQEIKEIREIKEPVVMTVTKVRNKNFTF